jgi:hypothetical protein
MRTYSAVGPPNQLWAIGFGTIDQLVNNADVFTFVKDEPFQITSRWEVDAESQHCLA